MIANPEFQNQQKMFWAYVRTLSQHLGYTVKKQKQIKVYSLEEMRASLTDLGLEPTKIAAGSGLPTPLGMELLKYFDYRAKILNDFAESKLMSAAEALALYEDLRSNCKFQCSVPMNKQKGPMAKPAYFTMHPLCPARTGFARGFIGCLQITAHSVLNA